MIARTCQDSRAVSSLNQRAGSVPKGLRLPLLRGEHGVAIGLAVGNIAGHAIVEPGDLLVAGRTIERFAGLLGDPLARFGVERRGCPGRLLHPA